MGLTWLLPVSPLPTGLRGADGRLVHCPRLLLGKAVSGSSRYPGALPVQAQDYIALVYIQLCLGDYLCNHEK